MVRHRSAQAVAAAGALLLLLAAPASARGQADAIGTILDSLAANRYVRVDLSSRADGVETLAGPVVSRGGDGFAVGTSGETRRVRYTEVRRLWIERGRLGGRGAWMGALIGGGAGAALGLVGAATDDTGEISGGALVLAFTVSPAVVGGLVGYVLGHHQRDWELGFEAEGARIGIRIDVPTH